MSASTKVNIFLGTVDAEPWEETVLAPYFAVTNQRDTTDGWACDVRWHSAHGILRERKKGTIEFDLAEGRRLRTGTRDRGKAVNWAYKQLVEEHVKALAEGRDGPEPQAAPSRITYSEIGPLLKRKNLLASWQDHPGLRRNQELVLAIFDSAWPAVAVVATSASHIKDMFRLRTQAGGLVWPERYADRRKLRKVGDRTVYSNLMDLKTLLELVCQEKDEKGRPFLEVNPLARLDLTGGRGQGRGRRRKIPKRRMPDAGEERYSWVIREADRAVELKRAHVHHTSHRQFFEALVPGILRMHLVVSYGHGQRPAAVANLRLDDIALTPSEVAKAIRSLRLLESDDRIPPEWADEWPYGAIVYRRENDKSDYERVVPLSAAMREELDLYLARRAAHHKARGIESPWLFPSHLDPTRCLSDKVATNLLRAAEQLAYEAVAEAGLNPEIVVPPLEKTAWYAYRRRWKSIRNDLGWVGTKAAAYVAGWSTEVGSIADVVYARMSAHTILAVVEGRSVGEVLEADPATERARQAVSVRPSEPTGAGGPKIRIA